MMKSRLEKDVARESAKVGDAFRKSRGLNTPWVIKLAVILGVWMTLSAMMSVARSSDLNPLFMAWAIVVLIMSVVGLVGVWRLRRWGVYLTVALAVAKLGNALLSGTNPKVFIFLLVVQCIICVPPLLYWRGLFAPSQRESGAPASRI